MPIQKVNPPIWLARGALAADIPAGSGVTAPPGSGATITIYDSTGGAAANRAVNGLQFSPPVPWARLVLHIDSSADSAASGVIIEGSTNGGTTWTAMYAAQTYLTANGPTDYDILVTMPQVRLRYTNSASVLTRWNMSLEGVIGDRSKGY